MTGIEVVFALAVVAVGFLYFSPFGPCPKCRGRGVIVNGRKARPCPRCKGARRQQRFGSRTVHRTVRLVRAELERTRKEKEKSS